MNRILGMIAAVALLAIPAGADCVPGAAWCSGNYAYDGSGNISSIGADTYAYDSSGRLITGTADFQRSGVLSRQNYGYDAYGNRVSASRTTGSTGCDVTCELNPSVDPVSNHLTGAGIAYDDAGNIVSIQDVVNGSTYVATYTYDALNMMRDATTTYDDRQFLYTADDERLVTRDGYSWTWTVRGMDGKILRSFTSIQNNGVPETGFQWQKDYVYRDGALLASATSGDSSALHFHLDHLGTPRVVTNDSGVVVGVHSYYPFGSELTLSPTESSLELSKFTGHERDLIGSEPHVVDDMHARYYMANLGRFMSLDPARDWDTKKPESWNLYSYVQDNPETRLDPTGRCGEAANFIGPRLPCPPPKPQQPAADGFVFGSLTTTPDVPVRGAAEGIALVGYNSKKGAYAGVIGAVGGEIGSHENYIGAFKGVEKTTGGDKAETIDIKEAQVGVEIPFIGGGGAGGGTYKTGTETGVFAFVSGGVIGQHGAVGIGVSLDTFKVLAPYIKTPEIPGQDIQVPTP